MFKLAAIPRWLGMGRGEPIDADDMVRRRVMQLAWPAVLQGLLLTSLQVVDTYLVSLLSDEALAAVGTSVQLIFVLLVVLIALEVGGSVLVAQAVGAKDRERASATAKQTILIGLVLAIILGTLGYALRGPMLGVFGLEPEVERLALEYWSIIALSLPAITFVFILSGILRGTGDTRTPMLATGLAAIVNAIVAYVLIFGVGPFPELGVQGAALGTTFGWTSEVLLMAIMLQRGDRPLSLSGRHDWFPTGLTIRSIGKIGGPTAAEEMSFSLGFAMLTFVVAVLGTAELAAHRIVFNALNISFMPGLGLALAATALVGQAVGARDPDTGRRVTKIAAQYAGVWMGLMGFGYFVLATPIVDAFTSDPDVLKVGTRSIQALSFSQAFWGMLLVFSGALRGTGKSVYPMVVNSLMVWSAVGLSFLAIELGFGLPAIWLMFAVVAPLPTFFLWRRLRREPLLNQQPTEGISLDPDLHLPELDIPEPEPVGARER